MNYDEKLDRIYDDVSQIKARLLGTNAPVGGTGLYALVKPAARNISPYVNQAMTSPDATEALERARHGVTWAGTTPLSDERWAEVWDEIERLKAGDPATIEPYTWLNPEFVGFALLTDLINQPKYDPPLSSTGPTRRKVFAGVTVQSFLDSQRALTGRAGGPRIG